MSEAAGPASHGRVAEDGTVYVITADGERPVGQVPDVTPEEAIAFFVRRYQALESEVSLLEKRLEAATVSASDARHAINKLRGNIKGANAVGDLAALETRLDALVPVVDKAAQVAAEKKQAAQAEAKTAKEAMVAEAEKLALGNDWRGGVDRFRALLEQWKALPRLDRASDDELWHRFSAARTTYTRRRKAQFAEQAEKREAAKRAKQKIIEEARILGKSTDWGPATGGFRDLMARWKAAGPAPRDIDDKLWAEFRSIQDDFFAAKQGVIAEQDAEFAGNQQAKEALLAKAEAEIDPEADLEGAKKAFSEFLDEYNTLGKVPRDAIRPLENRVRTLSDKIKAAEEAEWARTDPEARERAQDTVAMWTAHIDKLKKQLAEAEANGDQQKIRDTQQSIETYQSWLDQAQAALDDFTR